MNETIEVLYDGQVFKPNQPLTLQPNRIYTIKVVEQIDTVLKHKKYPFPTFNLDIDQQYLSRDKMYELD
jgi:predicted DNA-binding antitoxin AbrB/MazE fold protein